VVASAMRHGVPFSSSNALIVALNSAGSPAAVASKASMDATADIHYIGVARQLGYTGSTLESEHTICPTITLRHWPNWSTQFDAGITEMKHWV
jgi:hypothetical protein